MKMTRFALALVTASCAAAQTPQQNFRPDNPNVYHLGAPDEKVVAAKPPEESVSLAECSAHVKAASDAARTADEFACKEAVKLAQDDVATRFNNMLTLMGSVTTTAPNHIIASGDDFKLTHMVARGDHNDRDLLALGRDVSLYKMTFTDGCAPGQKYTAHFEVGTQKFDEVWTCRTDRTLGVPIRRLSSPH